MRHVRQADDYIDTLFHAVAEKLFAQLEEGKSNPAMILSSFTEGEEHKKAAELFQTAFTVDLSNVEKENALNEMLIRVKSNSLDQRIKKATDFSQLQKLIEEQKNLKKIHIVL